MGGDDTGATVEDIQPPMCGGAVFSKLRLAKPKDKPKERSLRGGIRAFDQRPVRTNDSPSATSSDNSYDEDPMGPEIALLNESSSSNHSRRGSRFSLFRKSFLMAPIAEDQSFHPKAHEPLRAEFLLDEDHPGAAVEFDPTDINQLRIQRIRQMSNSNVGNNSKNNKIPTTSRPTTSNALAATPTVPSRSQAPSKVLPSSSSASSSSSSYSSSSSSASTIVATRLPRNPKGKQPRAAAAGTAGTAPKDIATAEDATDNASHRTKSSGRTVKAILVQQQEALRIMSSQNEYYRRKLDDAESSFQKLYTDQVTQSNVIEKLHHEKVSFETETLLLREEMAAVRKQLELFQMQFVPKTTPSSADDVQSKVGARSQGYQQSREATSNTPRKAERKLADGSSFQRFVDPQRQHGVSIESEKIDCNESPQEAATAADPAHNYWKREWELSIKGMTESVSSTKYATNKDEEVDVDVDVCDEDAAEDREDRDGPEEITTECADNNAVDSTRLPVPTSGLPVRGVDPPEIVVKKKQPNVDAADKTLKSEYQRDMEFVHHLLAKYQKDKTQGSQQHSGKRMDSNSAKMAVANERNADDDAANEQDTLVEIENMFEVDIVYKQRQAEMERMRELYEKVDHSPAQVKAVNNMTGAPEPKREQTPSLSPGETKENVPTASSLRSPKLSGRGSAAKGDHSSRSQHSCVRFKPSVEEETYMYVPEPLDTGRNKAAVTKCHPVVPGNVRLQEPTVPEYSQRSEYSAALDSRQDDSTTFRSERTDFGLTWDPSMGTEHSAYRETPRNNDVSQHSETTEYADHIEHSTSRHHALLWAQSAVRSERSSRSFTSSHRDDSVTGTRSVSGSSDDLYRGCFWDGEMMHALEPSEHTLAEVHEPGQQGRRGGTYKIKMTSTSSSNQNQGGETQQRTAAERRDPSERRGRTLYSNRNGHYSIRS